MYLYSTNESNCSHQNNTHITNRLIFLKRSSLIYFSLFFYIKLPSLSPSVTPLALDFRCVLRPHTLREKPTPITTNTKPSNHLRKIRPLLYKQTPLFPLIISVIIKSPFPHLHPHHHHPKPHRTNKHPHAPNMTQPKPDNATKPAHAPHASTPWSMPMTKPAPVLSTPAQDTATATITSSSVSSPSAPDSDCAASVDDLLDGIDRARLDAHWSLPQGFDRPDAHPLATLFGTGVGTPFTPLAGLPTSACSSASLSASQPRARAPQPSMKLPPCALAPRAPADLPAFADAAPLVVASVPLRLEFPRMFKVMPCPTRDACVSRGDFSECFYYHGENCDRRRVNVDLYKPHMCRFIDEGSGCRKADRCPFSHNDFERRYHPDRFGKETCRDYLRGDCPRRFCTFRHEVSRKVSVALDQMDGMVDKEMLQFVLKISEERGRALCDKLLRRFGHGKKHSGWRLEGFVVGSRDDEKVRCLTGRVDAIKRRLKTAGEKKWAAGLKTSGLRDMMSGVRKIAEEMRERCRADEQFVENGSDVHRLIRSVFSSTNWSCHSQEGDNPFLVTPDNQNDAVSALERLVDCFGNGAGSACAGKKTVGGVTAWTRQEFCSQLPSQTV